MKSSREHTAHSPDSGRTLVVMAKAPRPGMVKTRLTQSLPVEAVTELYRCLLDDTMALACSLSSVKVAIMFPSAVLNDIMPWRGSAGTVRHGRQERRSG